MEVTPIRSPEGHEKRERTAINPGVALLKRRVLCRFGIYWPRAGIRARPSAGSRYPDARLAQGSAYGFYLAYACP